MFDSARLRPVALHVDGREQCGARAEGACRTPGGDKVRDPDRRRRDGNPGGDGGEGNPGPIPCGAPIPPGGPPPTPPGPPPPRANAAVEVLARTHASGISATRLIVIPPISSDLLISTTCGVSSSWLSHRMNSQSRVADRLLL